MARSNFARLEKSEKSIASKNIPGQYRGMLDIKKARENPENLRKRLALRGKEAAQAFDEWLTADAQWRALSQECESALAEKNRIAKAVGAAKSKNQDAGELLEQGKVVSEKLVELEKKSREAEDRVRSFGLLVPNVPHESVPPGSDSSQNVVVKSWGEPKKFDFAPRHHVELLEKLGWVDFGSAAKITGSGFAVFRGFGARLERALINFLLDLHTRQHGYLEVSPPFLVHSQSMVGTGQLPKFVEDMYRTNANDDNNPLYLVPTAEVPVTNLYRETLLKEQDLPMKMTAYTPCFRKEAGSAGRETRGLIRMHQFDKVELVWITRPEDSYNALETLKEHAERVLQLLGLHYRVVALCTGDMGFGAAKCYDIEVWAPGEGRYLEVSSCSNFEDFQSRRMGLRYKNSLGKNIHCHTLNGSGTALARLYVALVETYQNSDGSITLPHVLNPYIGEFS